jgi:hypothetical protein
VGATGGHTIALLCKQPQVRHTIPRAAPEGAAGKWVVRAEGLVLDFGLFLASNPLAWVIVESLSSPSGYGLHRLTAWELGDL